MNPHQFLWSEGLTVFVLALAGYFTVGGPLWLLAVLALAPDLAMLGYLAGPRIGSLCYNVAHTYTLPLALGAAALQVDSNLALLVSLVWAGHIGADRLVGYGLKYDTGFKDTHLSTQPVPVDALTESETETAGQ
jgi:hypothetical protein